LLGTIGSTIGGTIVGNMIFHSLFNKRGEPAQVPETVPEEDRCFTQHKTLLMCLEKNKENLNFCQFTLDLFEECRLGTNTSKD